MWRNHRLLPFIAKRIPKILHQYYYFIFIKTNKRKKYRTLLSLSAFHRIGFFGKYIFFTDSCQLPKLGI